MGCGECGRGVPARMVDEVLSAHPASDVAASCCDEALMINSVKNKIGSLLSLYIYHIISFYS